jgi:hypothetical protein
MEADNSPDAAFKRLMLTHTLHASKRGETVKTKLASLEKKQENTEKELETLHKSFAEYRGSHIKELEDRLAKVERKLLIAYGVVLTVGFVPYLPAIFKFLSQGSN